MVSNRHAAITSQLRQGQAQARKNFAATARVHHERLARASGYSMLGRARDGSSKETRYPWEFGIVVDRWLVCLGFKHEDPASMDARFAKVRMDVRALEADVGKRFADRTVITFDTHIITAVRVFEHVEESYAKEVEATTKLMELLNGYNVFLAETPQLSTPQLGEVVALLRKFDAEVLSRKRVAVKRIFSRARLTEAIARFEAAQTLASAPRQMELGRGCAVLSSVRNRLSQWRDKDIANMVERACEKQAALRVERDRWLFAQVSRWAEMAEQVHYFWRNDCVRIQVLERVEAALHGAEPDVSNLLAYIAGHASRFKVEGHEDLLGRYRNLYREVRRFGRTQDSNAKAAAQKQIDSMLLFINANKPPFIVSELAKSPNYFTKSSDDGFSVLDFLVDGVHAFEQGNIAQAKSYFGAARLRMIAQGLHR